MVDSYLDSVIEDLQETISKLTAENIALQKTVIAILASMPIEQASAVKSHVEEINSAVANGGSSEAVELLEAQTQCFQNLFQKVK